MRCVSGAVTRSRLLLLHITGKSGFTKLWDYSCLVLSKTREETRMYYEINVALDGKHFFATHPRSITDENQVVAVYEALRERFKPQDGFDITATRWPEECVTITHVLEKRY